MMTPLNPEKDVLENDNPPGHMHHRRSGQFPLSCEMSRDLPKYTKHGKTIFKRDLTNPSPDGSAPGAALEKCFGCRGKCSLTHHQ